MEQLSFQKKQRTKIKVDIYGEVFELRKPQVGEAEFFSGDIENLSPSEKFEKTVEMMGRFGLPVEAAKKMELEHFNELVLMVMGGGGEKKS
jgi:hypothetical protein